MENFEKIKELVAIADGEVTKFENGNASAGTRARQALLEIGKLTKTVREEIQSKKNATKGK